MVAVIKTSGSLRNTLHYNENKLKQNTAQFIHSMNYGKETEQLRFTDKIKTVEKLTSLNERTKLNSVHISLNFDPSEKLSKELLQKIAETYMRGIGFGKQPFLVYQHHDAGHPHIHIVTTNIEANGQRIKMQNIGRNQSEKARIAIEKEFKLVQAQNKQLKQVYELKPVNGQKVQYGKSETKRAITNVLNAILPTYKYASLPELNALLKQYNIVADRGSENSRTYKNNGLVYRALDDKGQKIGAPVKASAIHNNAGLKFLSEKFSLNEPLKQTHRLRVKNAIDLSFVIWNFNQRALILFPRWSHYTFAKLRANKNPNKSLYLKFFFTVVMKIFHCLFKIISKYLFQVVPLSRLISPISVHLLFCTVIVYLICPAIGLEKLH